MIPVARGFAESNGNTGYCCALPTTVGVDDEGNWSPGEVVARHAKLWAIAQQCWDSMRDSFQDEGAGASEARIAFDFADTHDAALLALSTNYRVGKVEVALLELFHDQCVGRILLAMVDFPTIVEWMNKKKRSLQQDNLSLSAGREA
jgi:hypothetical protein